MGVERKFVSDGLRRAQTNEFLLKSLEKAEYGGMEINRTPMGTQLTIFSGRPGMVIGKSGKVVRKITSDLENSFKFDNPQIDVQQVSKPELNAQMMASSLSNLLERGWHFRKAGFNTLGRIMRAGALGCEVIISGKLTGTRSRSAKFLDGYIKHSGKCTEEMVDKGFAVAKRKSGVLGVKVLIVRPDAKITGDFHILRNQGEEVAEEAEKEQKEEEAIVEETKEAISEEKEEEQKEIIEETPEDALSSSENDESDEAQKMKMPPEEVILSEEEKEEPVSDDEEEK